MPAQFRLHSKFPHVETHSHHRRRSGRIGSGVAMRSSRLAVDLFEMRPVRSTPAHQTANFAELVCSNSLKSDSENTAPWLLKEEMRRAGSLLMEIARQTAVPAGHALAVDREKFSETVTEAIEREPLIRVVREEVTRSTRTTASPSSPPVR